MEATETANPAPGPSRAGGFPTGVSPFDTTEVRWFAAGRLPRSLVDWFTCSGRCGTLEDRHDRYLAGGGPELGRKRRNLGPYEIKTRRRVGDTITLNDRLSGRLEEWRKMITTVPPAAKPADRWSEVRKVLLTRTYHMAAPDRIVEVPFSDVSVSGCDIELGALTVTDISAWTFALEAWGPPDLRRSLLERAAAAFIEDSGLPMSVTSHLTAAMGYPEWLAETVWRDRS